MMHAVMAVWMMDCPFRLSAFLSGLAARFHWTCVQEVRVDVDIICLAMTFVSETPPPPIARNLHIRRVGPKVDPQNSDFALA